MTAFDVSLDRQAGAAYVTTVPVSVPVARTEQVHPQVHLDYDAAGNLVGVEVM